MSSRTTEVQSLEAWLGADSRRLVVLDAVYTFAPRFTGTTERLLRTGQALLVHSLAKGHLTPDLAGFALVPGAVAHGVDGFETPQLEPLALRQACFLLEQPPGAARTRPGSLRGAVGPGA